jgi:hypothetical protein
MTKAGTVSPLKDAFHTNLSFISSVKDPLALYPVYSVAQKPS